MYLENYIVRRQQCVIRFSDWYSLQDVEEDELKKIWKGLFFCLWHSDKAHVQGDLINKLAGILDSSGRGYIFGFLQSFSCYHAARVEWNR